MSTYALRTTTFLYVLFFLTRERCCCALLLLLSPPQNFASECVHFRYFVTHAEVSGCTVQVRSRSRCKRSTPSACSFFIHGSWIPSTALFAQQAPAKSLNTWHVLRLFILSPRPAPRAFPFFVSISLHSTAGLTPLSWAREARLERASTSEPLWTRSMMAR